MLTLALACSHDPTDTKPPDTQPSGDTDTDTDTRYTVTFGDSGSSVPDAISGLTTRVHPQIGSILYASWIQRDAGTTHVEYSFDDGVWLSTPPRDLGEGSHEEMLLGIPYGTAVTWHVVEGVDGDPITSADVDARTDALPADAPQAFLASSSDPSRTDPASPYLYLSVAGQDGFDGRWWVYIIDRQGRTVWALESRPQHVSMHSRVAKDGKSLYEDQNSFWGQFDGGQDSSIVQMYIDGTVIHEFETPGEHHDWTDLPDGTIAYGATIDPSYYGDEYLQEVRVDGGTRTVWKCDDWLETATGQTSGCMSNTLNYDPASNTFLFSFWTLESVVRIDASTGQTTSWYGHVPGSYAFDPPDSAFWYQHGGYITDAGTFLTSSDRTTNGVETVVREYSIDDANHVLHEVWNFGLDQGVYGRQMGEAIRLPNGNTLHNYGEGARIREVTPAGEVVWDIGWHSDAVGRSMPIGDLYALAPPDRP